MKIYYLFLKFLKEIDEDNYFAFSNQLRDVSNTLNLSLEPVDKRFAISSSSPKTTLSSSFMKKTTKYFDEKSKKVVQPIIVQVKTKLNSSFSKMKSYVQGLYGNEIQDHSITDFQQEVNLSNDCLHSTANDEQSEESIISLDSSNNSFICKSLTSSLEAKKEQLQPTLDEIINKCGIGTEEKYLINLDINKIKEQCDYVPDLRFKSHSKLVDKKSVEKEKVYIFLDKIAFSQKNY
jgi:hypothetical protein